MIADTVIAMPPSEIQLSAWRALGSNLNKVSEEDRDRLVRNVGSEEHFPDAERKLYAIEAVANGLAVLTDDQRIFLREQARQLRSYRAGAIAALERGATSALRSLAQRSRDGRSAR